MTDDETAGPAGVEGLKVASNYLRDPLVAEFAAGGTHISEDGYQILKFHGSYQQDDRDQRNDRRKAGEEYAYGFMIRLRIPGGDVHPGLWEALDDLAERFGRSTLRLTTRQSIQLHFVPKADLRTVIRTINDRLASTLGACGDVNRNVMAAPLPVADAAVRGRRATRARAIAEHLLPRTRAYAELWLDGEEVARIGPDGGAPDRGGADLRAHVPAAQVQDLRDRGRRQLGGPLHPRPGIRRHLRGRPAAGLERVRGRRTGPHAPQARDLPAPGRPARLRRARSTCCAWRRASSSSSATTAIAPTDATPA